MDARFMQMHNFVLTREIIINSIFPVDRMRELNFHRETAVNSTGKFGFDSTPCTVMGHNILFLSVIFITVVAFGSGKQ